jgi:hypothetical protein
MWYDEIDDWFSTLYRDTDEFKAWEEGINWVRSNASKYVKSNGD